jgi:hypothetical protein
MTTSQEISEMNLVLAAEDFDRDNFKALHKFSKNDERVIAKLMAHGPVLLQGSRGSGKSALMLEAADRLSLSAGGPALAVYLSLRHMPLLRSVGDVYQRILCELLIERVRRVLDASEIYFDAEPTLTSVQSGLTDLAQSIGRRLVIMFDDAAHLGREASLADFFDVFRTLSNSSVSCKATIYPGVTNFGIRFDVYNDATVVDVIRDEDQSGFSDLFTEVVRVRYPDLAARRFASDLTLRDFANFVGKSVLGNMRGFLYACNALSLSEAESIGLSELGKCFLELTTNYYWPLIDEVKPKLGKYVPIVDSSKEIVEILLRECGRTSSTSAIVHRDIVARLAKAFEILEYTGFISKRESSKAMKSGGRGSRYAINLCMLLENIAGARLTQDVYSRLNKNSGEPIQIHSRGELLDISLPAVTEDQEPDILNDPIETLRKSRIYPYGLTDNMTTSLRDGGFITIRDACDSTDQRLDDLPGIGAAKVTRIRNVIGQAVWM